MLFGTKTLMPKALDLGVSLLLVLQWHAVTSVEPLLEKSMTVQNIRTFFAARAAQDPHASAMVNEENVEALQEEFPTQQELLEELSRRYPQVGTAANILQVYGTGPPEVALPDRTEMEARKKMAQERAAEYAANFLEGDEL